MKKEHIFNHETDRGLVISNDGVQRFRESVPLPGNRISRKDGFFRKRRFIFKDA